ncbi:MAG TPA: ABC transporter substrate-binding protein [Bryobacteraceae bacterium]
MPRIVSLISSATEIVAALGQLDNLVGRSHECDYPEEVKSLPVCTRPRIDIHADSLEIDRAVRESKRNSVSIYDVFEDVIERLEPTHILTQIQCEVCAVSLRDVEDALARGMKGNPKIISSQPDSLDQIWQDIRRIADSLDIPARGAALVTEICEKISRAERNLPPAPTPNPHPLLAACIEWIEPLMAAGFWMPELICLAAAKNVAFSTFDELAAADPDVIVVAPCGFDLPRTESEMYWLTRRPGWNDLRAVRGGRVYLADGNRYFNRPGPFALTGTLDILMEMLHPDVCAPRHRGSAWRDMMIV